MSHFTIALNDVLDRMKDSSGISRLNFAARIGMPSPSLSSYSTGRTKPDASALGTIAAGLEEADARRIVLAHLIDETPEAWRGRLQPGGAPDNRPIRLADCDDLPPAFRRNIELMLLEARHNEHVIGFVEEFVTLLGLEESKQLWPVPRGKMPVQNVPTRVVRSSSRPGDSMPPPAAESLLAAEDPPASRPRKPSGPRARSARAPIRKMVQRERKP